MKKLVFAFCSLLMCSTLFSQKKNTIKVDIGKSLYQIENFDKTKKIFVVSISNYNAKDLDMFEYTVSYGTKDLDTLDKNPNISLDCSQILPDNMDKPISFTIIIRYSGKNRTELRRDFLLTRDGKIDITVADPDQGKTKPAPARRMLKPKNADHKPIAFFDESKLPKPETTDCKNYNLVVYEPCCNTYTITSLGVPEKKFLRYRTYKPGKTNGVIFMIKDFNTTKYDISVTNDFESLTPDMPDIFSSVYNIIGGAVAMANVDNTLENQLLLINDLNKDLKKYFIALPNCKVSSLDPIKTGILAVIRSTFEVSNELDFDQLYQSIKNAYIANEQSNDPKYDNETFNKEVAASYGLNPDELVNETKQLLITFLTTKYEYQYNVPQLRNADAIVFTVNVKPKDGSNGTIHVVDQPIRIPIHGGLKIDFTTGLYYSTVRNNYYALKATADSSHQEIIDEKKSSYTIGINGLMHISSRLGEVNPSLVLGVGKSTELNYSLLVGVGVTFGAENRFALSGGFNFSSIKQLSAQYLDDNGARSLLPISATTINTSSVFKKGAFFSLTYSLGLTKKTQEASKEGGDGSSGKKSNGKEEEESKEGKGKDESEGKTGEN